MLYEDWVKSNFKLRTYELEGSLLPDKGLPRTDESQEIGQDAADCLRANRPTAWRLKDLDGDNDFGFDYQVQITSERQVIYPFRLQLKGTRAPIRSKDGAFLSISIKTSTLRYYNNTNEPVLLVLCDLSVDKDPRNCTPYYVWVRGELERIDIESISLDQNEAVLRIPTVNILTRVTDLLEEVHKQHRLSRAGHKLASSVAGMAPAMASEDRVIMVEAITTNIGTRSIVFAQALADSANDIWINPPRDSVAWLLTESKSAITSGKVDRCSDLLKQAEPRMSDATSIEQAEFWHLTGRLALVQDDASSATQAFKTAATMCHQARYWAAWAESELRDRFRVDVIESFDDVIGTLPETQDPILLAIKARLLAASQRYDEAIALLDSFNGSESLAARAVVQTMAAKFEEALAACIEGIELEDHQHGPRWLLFLILRARARFYIALRNAEMLDAIGPENILPPCGPLGADAACLRSAWNDIEEAVAALEEIRWVSNAEFIADIWIATAAMLGKQEQVAGRVIAAARSRPNQPELQAAAESIAAQCGNYTAALEANSRSPDGEMKFLHRIMILHELGKHRDCVELLLVQFEGINTNHQLFAPALVLAIISADILAKADLIESWRAILRSGDVEQQAHDAVLEYLLAQRRNEFQNSIALPELVRADELLGHPRPITLLLFQELDPSISDQAEQLLAVAARLRATTRLSPLVAKRMSIALATVGRWAELLSLCEEAAMEFDVPNRLKAFHAFALDRLGRSDEARGLLESIFDDGDDDGLALNLYVNIMVRWGDTGTARDAVEKMLERAQTREHQMECIRLLFNFEQQHDPNSPRLISLASRMGQLALQNDEAEEVVFLSMVATLGGAALNTAHTTEFQRRANAFFERFPQSKLLRRVELSDEAGAEEILRSMKLACGMTEDREQARANLEARLRSGTLPLPFALRPNMVLGNVQDVAHLWELCKQSAQEDKQLHLEMIGQIRKLRATANFASRTPLFDLITLLVLKDLDLIELMFEHFSQIAIGQETLAELRNLTHHFSGSVFHQKCMDLQVTLRSYQAKILQPYVNSTQDQELPNFAREIKYLLQSDRFVLYSDDVAFRLLMLGDKFDSDGLCTLDFLSSLEESGRLSTEQVAEHLATLCDWHVGVQLDLRHHIALIQNEVSHASSVGEGVGLLRANARFMAIANAIWSPTSGFSDSLKYMGFAGQQMAQSPLITDIVISSMVTIWAGKFEERSDIPLTATDLATQFVLCSLAPIKLPLPAVKRLWNVYFGVIGTLGSNMNGQLAATALANLAFKAGRLDARSKLRKNQQSSTMGERLIMGLEYGSTNWDRFCEAYLKGLNGQGK